MLINNKKLDFWGITVLQGFDIDTSNYKCDDRYWSASSLLPVTSKQIEDFRKLHIEVLFEDASKEDIIKNISIFNEEVKHSVIKKGNLNYKVELDGSLTKNQINQCTFAVSHSFIVIDVYEDEKSITTTKNTSININSPKPCYANLELTSNANVISYTLKINDNEIVVNNIKGNETVYIGSGKVIAGEKSKINDVDIWEFPILKPGSNTITVSRSDVNLKIKYYERW